MTGRAAAMAMVLAGAGLAQQGRGRLAPGAGRAPAASPVSQDLLRLARQAVNNSPTLLAPRFLADVARDELRGDRAQALRDDRQAFILARALNPADAGAEAIKEEVEQRAVTELARWDRADQALQLVRLADVPKGPLYGQLIVAALRPGPADDGPEDLNDEAGARARRQLDHVFALVQECKRADGSFPYRGVATALRRLDGAPLDRLALVRDGYQWAAGETDPGRIASAAFFLDAGHRAEPALDGLLADTVAGLVVRLTRADGADAAVGARDSSRLMALLDLVAPDRARAITAQFPEITVPPPASPRVGRVPALRVTVSDGVLGGPDGAEAESQAPELLRLLAEAEKLQRGDPRQSLRLAGQAASLLAPPLLQAQVVAATRLAALDYQLGDSADGSRLLGRCLDEADRQGSLADAQFDDADGDQLALWARGSAPYENIVTSVYSLAARLDFTSAAARAASAPFVLLKPVVLARLALVGEIQASPRRNAVAGGGGRGR